MHFIVLQERLVLPQHMSSPPVFCVVHVAQSAVFVDTFLLALFPLVIVLSVHRFTVSDNPHPLFLAPLTFFKQIKLFKF